MLDVKQAAEKAAEYFSGLYATEKFQNVQLEEVELTEDEESKKWWLITLSYPVGPELAPLNFNFKRKYKVFKIDANTGEVKSMKIRRVE